MEPISDRTATEPLADAFDEAFDDAGAPRGAYEELFDRIDPVGFGIEAERARAEIAAAGVTFGGEGRPFHIDSVPRLVEAAEWDRIRRGLAQRARALNAFLPDVYGERRIVAAGVLPADLVETAEWYEPAMADPGMPAVRAHVAGPDLVRSRDGELLVLEDNLRAPSGLAYALAARRLLRPLVERSGLEPRPLDGGPAALGELLRSAAPDGTADPLVVLLTDGPGAAASYEHRELARLLGLEVAEPGDLRRRGDRLMLGGRGVAVVYRRVDDERLSAAEGTRTELGELLIEPLRAGTLACVNSPGSGIADDKAVHAHVEAIVSFYLGEEPLLRSVPSRWLGEPGALEWALARIDELVVKPRAEFGGAGLTIGPAASAEELEAAAARLRADPHAYVAQTPIPLSTHPTVVGGRLESRRVDLRPFILSPTEGEETVTVVPGGLTRFARGAGDLVVNSGQGGGAKDTWVL